MNPTVAFKVALCTFETYPELDTDFIIDDDGLVVRSAGIAAGHRVLCRVCGRTIKSRLQPVLREGGSGMRFLQPVIGRFGVLFTGRYYMQHINCTQEEHLYPDPGDSDYDDGDGDESDDDAD